MRGLMMDTPLTIDAIARRAEAMSAEREVVSLGGEGGPRRESWGTALARARRLAAALQGLGVGPGDRVASLCWNQAEHLDLYFGVPMVGGVLHTLNPRLRPQDLAGIVRAAGSRILVADASLRAVLREIAATTELEHAIVVGEPGEGELSYADLLDGADDDGFSPHLNEESDACTLCFTTGTTGRPKGVLYSHRAVALQALSTMAADFGGVSAADKILVAVPMFHGNAWNQPYAAALAGSALVLPHSDLRPERLLATIEAERVTMIGGVPTIWRDVLAALDREPGRFDLSSLRLIRIGGDRTSVDLLRGLVERHGLPVVCGFGMTELGPTGGMAANPDRAAGERLDWDDRARTGYPVPFLEVRISEDDSEVAWNGVAVGELEYRGPSVASAYWDGEGEDSFSEDGWLRSGDIAAVAPDGLIDIRDRSKDLIKSGGEWISSVLLEQALQSHPEVEEAAVVGVADARWQERPLAVIVAGDGVGAEQLHEHLRPLVPRWWLPERFEFVDSLPRTEMGKIRKNELRERYSASMLGSPGSGEA